MTYEEFEVQRALGSINSKMAIWLLLCNDTHPWIKYTLRKAIKELKF